MFAMDPQSARQCVFDSELSELSTAAPPPMTSVETLFEWQASLAALARRNLALNGLAVEGEAQDDGAAAATARARLCECDLADAGTYPHGAFDGVLCNPPFYSDGSGRGRPTRSAEKADAFFESTLDLAGFVQVLSLIHI